MVSLISGAQGGRYGISSRGSDSDSYVSSSDSVVSFGFLHGAIFVFGVVGVGSSSRECEDFCLRSGEEVRVV